MNNILVAQLNGELFRALSFNENDDVEQLRKVIEADAKAQLDFTVMDRNQYEEMLSNLPKPPQPPSLEERLQIAEDTIIKLMNIIDNRGGEIG